MLCLGRKSLVERRLGHALFGIFPSARSVGSVMGRAGSSKAQDGAKNVWPLRVRVPLFFSKMMHEHFLARAKGGEVGWCWCWCAYSQAAGLVWVWRDAWAWSSCWRSHSEARQGDCASDKDPAHRLKGRVLCNLRRRVACLRLIVMKREAEDTRDVVGRWISLFFRALPLFFLCECVYVYKLY